MTIIISAKELKKVMPLFHGQACWNVVSCGIGHALWLYFGKALEYLGQDANDRPKKWFRGQYELGMYCSWRFDDENHNPIISSMMSEYHDIKITMISLMGDTIESIGIIPPVWEATIRFSSGKQLRTFCDLIPAHDVMGNNMNWWCDTENASYYVGTGQEINKDEPRPHLVSHTLYAPDQIDPNLVRNSDKYYKPIESNDPEDGIELQ
jgi:hypothetical protein